MGVENLVIVGSGPAGYTAAIYAARANLNPLLITGFQDGGIPGGQLMTTTHVENFPGFPDGILGPDLMDRMKAQALRWGTRQVIETQAVILATGASANRLGLPSEARFWSKGISACAICDGATPQFRGEPVAVVGGGDSACEEAVYLTKYGSHVHLIVRTGTLRASAAMADRVLANPNITVHWNRQVADASGSDWLEAIELRDSSTGACEELPIKGLFYAIGHTAAGSGCQAALAAERWLSHHDLAVTVSREQVEPQQVGEPQRTAVSDEANYDPNALWQKGSYALRKLYHDSNKPLLVVYTSPTCGPCHVLKPQLKRVLEELGGRAQGIEIDIEADQEIAVQAGVTGTPTVQLFVNKELKQTFRGVKQRSEFKAAIEGLLGVPA